MADTIPLTTQGRLTLALARGIAASRGNANLQPAHVALAMLHFDNVGVAMLSNAGVPLGKLRQDLETQLPPQQRPLPRESAIPASEGELRIVEQAAREAVALDNQFIGSQHLLIALMRDDTFARVFARYGFTPESAAEIGPDFLTSRASQRAATPPQ